jgi:hypothetical protein
MIALGLQISDFKKPRVEKRTDSLPVFSMRGRYWWSKRVQSIKMLRLSVLLSLRTLAYILAVKISLFTEVGFHHVSTGRDTHVIQHHAIARKK